MITGKVQPPERLEKPRRLSDLALNCCIYVLDWFLPTDIERGAIAVPESIKERAAERGLGRRRGSYDQLRSPPPEFVSYAEEAVGGSDGRRGNLGTTESQLTREGEVVAVAVGKAEKVRVEEVIGGDGTEAEGVGMGLGEEKRR